MHNIPTLRFLSSLLGFIALFGGSGFAQDWRSYAVTEADKDAPCSIPWERSLEDALLLASESGRPLLVAVCVDGEAASEVFAHKLYKDAEYIRLMRGFVPIVFSPIRHNPKDYSDKGERILCPRFGSVTCGEHAADEQIAFERWFDGVRYTPRHVGVSPDGQTILFDRHLDQDLSRVRRALRSHGVAEGAMPKRLDRRDSASRTALEADYATGTADFRVRVLLALPKAAVEHPQILRMALASTDPDERRHGLEALSAGTGAGSASLITKLLNDGTAGSFTSGLEQRLAALVATSAEALRSWRLLSSLDKTGELATSLNVPSWKRRLRSNEKGAADLLAEEEVLGRLEELSRQLLVYPGDPALELELAQQTLDLARAKLALGKSPGFLFQDARAAAVRARRAGAFPEEVAIVDSQAAYMVGEREAALTLALDAIPALQTTAAACSAQAAHVLDVLARLRTQQVYDGEIAGEGWQALWLAQAHAAYSILAVHPFGTEGQTVAHLDLLNYLGAQRWLGEVVQSALLRWPRSAELHARLRGHVHATLGSLALEQAYNESARLAEDKAAHAWFHGYATLMTAEEEVRQDQQEAARATYQRAIQHFEHSVKLEPSFAASADSFAALAQVGQARLCMESDLTHASELLLAAFVRAPTFGSWTDGFGMTPVETIGRLRAKIRKAEVPELAESLRDSLESIAPGVWEESEALPKSSTTGPPAN